MSRVYNVIDADGHVLEPTTLWNDYMDPAFRDRAPRLIRNNDGKEMLLVEEKILGSQQGMGGIGGVGARQGVVQASTMAYTEGRPGGFDPHKRIPDMDLDGIDAVFLYPSMGLFAGSVQDPPLAAAMCRGYNRWLADYCSPYPDRLFGIAMLPMQSIDLTIREMQFAKRELGFRGGFIRPNPYNNKMIHHPDYEPFWQAAEDLDFAIGFHEGGNSGMPTVGIDRFAGRAAQHIISHTMEMMLAAMSVIWGGVCERHPKYPHRLSRIGWRLDRTLARPHGPPFRRSGVQRFRPDHTTERAVPDVIAGSRSSRSRAASRCWQTISDRTRSSGRPTTRTATASFPARPR